MADIFVTDTGMRTFGDPSSETTLNVTVLIEWGTTDGLIFGIHDAVTVEAIPPESGQWSTLFLDAVKAWATANGHTIIRLVMVDYQLTTP
jgi:hypothetical protein